MSDKAALKADGVTVAIGGRTIVDNVTLALNAGELTVLVGPNGAGKTTLARALAGLIPCRGSVALGGKPLAAIALRTRARSLAYLPQGHVFHWPMRVESVVALGREPHADSFTMASSDDRDAIQRAMEATAVTELSDRSIDTLSGGERARVAMARALATEAGVLIADEPTASLDVRHQLTVMALLRNTARNGAAVLAIIHDLALAMRFADRIIVLDRGRIIADGTPTEALTPQRIAEVFGIAVDHIDTADGALLIPARALQTNPQQ